MKKFLLSFLLAISTFVLPVVAKAGTPEVSFEVVSTSTSTVKCKFAPNDFVSVYYFCLFEKGEFDQQFEMWKNFFNFTEPGDMVMQWGIARFSTTVNEWKGLNPGTEYEIYVLSLDSEDNYAPLQSFAVETDQQGGTGASVIDIQIMEFGSQMGTDENNNPVQLYYQRVIYTPNDQTARFYDLIITQDGYDSLNGAEGVKGYLIDTYLNPQWRDAYAMFGVDDAMWNAEPGTTYHACAVGMNALGEWGEMTDVVFTTEGSTIDTISENNSANDSYLYNINGQKVTTMQGGQLYFRNGKKIFSK
ncbi:MAG: hypothetical protein KBT20_02345 [Bacteroidales bacterium]|nr:hypothetical protein [Candidatus Liminaster caballi]